MTHLVNRLTFELECPGEEQAFELKQKFSAANHEQIAGIIDNVCSKYVNENEWIRIDKLEINLGEFDLVSFEQEFSKAFNKKFENIIAEKVFFTPKETLASSGSGSDLELLKFFLTTGRMPWWGDENTSDPYEISSSVFKNRHAEISDFFRKNYNNYAVWERASFQLKSEVLYVLIQSFDELRYAHDILELMLEKISGELNLIEEVKSLKFTGDLEQVRNMAVYIIVSNAPLIFDIGNDILKIKSVLAGQVLKKFVSLNNDPQLQKTVINLLNKGYEDILIPVVDPEPESMALVTGNDGTISNTDKSVIIDSLINKGSFKTSEDEKEKLIVRHAGIIMLAPYLKVFFSKLNLLDDNSWINKDAQFRGLFLLKYLSTGVTKTFEYQLILEKLLCGIRPEQPVPSQIMLNDKEMEESDLLLKSVIEHWKALKNTSLNGLRETFLKRDGIIMETENGWLLQVERKTVDVLLESIPWGFSTIRLPWNEYLIITEW